jgi:RimJ/RimL family protein N-acetyltransferase/catechol 2,3-dioxygenase-like lactoylglutathione lyase family enzyme
VRLEPLALHHHEGLCAAGLAPEIWRWIPYQVRTADEMRAYIEAGLRDQERGTAMPFATIDAATGSVIGSTRFMNIDAPNRRVEIGSTWLALDRQRTAANTEAKYLMLTHAFDKLGCNRVELKTDALNAKSRAAILRIGAKQEGIFRSHVICHDGRVRDSVYFSITREEWPGVRARLEERLGGAKGRPVGILEAATPAIVICTRDRARSTAFYRDTLGLAFASEDNFAAIFTIGGVTLRVSIVADFKAHEHTILGFRVPDVPAAVKALREKGVRFNIYPGFKHDELGIVTPPGSPVQVAWFKDPDGNVMSVSNI